MMAMKTKLEVQLFRGMQLDLWHRVWDLAGESVRNHVRDRMWSNPTNIAADAVQDQVRWGGLVTRVARKAMQGPLWNLVHENMWYSILYGVHINKVLDIADDRISRPLNIHIRNRVRNPVQWNV